MVRTFITVVILVGAALSAYADNEPRWPQLTDEQRQVLAPLSGEWDTLRPWQREKMLDIARDYPKMSRDQQQRVQKRLSNWSRMTPYERESARKQHQQFNSLPSDKQEELRRKWREYQKLSEAERQKLRNTPPETVPEDGLGK